MRDLAEIYSKLFNEGLLGKDVDYDTFLNTYYDDLNFKSQVDQYAKSLEQQRLSSGMQSQSIETDNILDNIPIIGDFLSDMVKYTVGGAKAGMSADESIALMKKVFGENKATDEEILEYIQAYNDMADPTTVTDEMQEYQRIYEEEGKSTWGVIRGLVNNPSVMFGLFLQSLSTQVSSALSSKEVFGAGVAGAGAGAAATSYAGFGSLMGGLAGGMGGLATGMEAALTFGELLKEEVGEGNFNLESVRDVLNDPEKANDFVQRALKRGLTIGAIETLTGGITAKATRVISRAGRGAALATGAGLTIEAAGGSLGEVAGRLAAEQEMDTSEIILEGVIGKGNSVINVLGNITKPGNYSINGEQFSGAEFVSKLNLMEAETLRKTDIKVENDDGVKNLVNEKRQEALYDIAIGEEVTDIKDRQEIINLEKQYAKVKDQTSVAGNIKATEIRNKIKKILNKYDGTTTASDVIKTGAFVRKTLNLKDNLSKTKAFAKLLGIGFKSMSNDEYVNFINEYNTKHKTNFETEGEGKIIQDNDTGEQLIVINKDEAMKSDQFTVGQHELLHGLLHQTLKNNDETAIKLGKELDSYLNKINIKEIKDSRFSERLAAYKQAVKDGKITEAERYEEVLTLTSEAMANNELKYDQTVFDKIADLFRQFLRKHFNVNMELNKAEDVFNFIKDYNKSFEEGKLYKSFGRLSKNALEGKLISEPALQKAKTIQDKNKLIDYTLTDSQRKQIVNETYAQKGIAAVDDVLPFYMSKVEAVVNQRRDYSMSDLGYSDIVEEKNDLVMDTMYNLLLHARGFKGNLNNDFDAWINSYIVQKFGTAAKKLQRKETKITETQERKARQRGVLDAVAEQAAISISEKIKIDPKVQKKLNTVVKQQVTDVLRKLAVGTKPRIAKLNLQDTFRQAIRKDLKNTIKKKEVYQKFLKDNFETYFNDVNVETLNKRFRGDKSNPDLFVRPTGKRVSKTATSQPELFEKQPWDQVKGEFLNYFLDGPPSRVGVRKDKIVEEISNYMAFEAAQQITSSPNIVDILNETGIQEVVDINADKLINDARNVTNIRSKLKISLDTYEAYGRPALTEFFYLANSDPQTFELLLEDIIAEVPENERADFTKWITEMQSEVVPLDKDGWSKTQEEYLKANDKDVYDLYTLDVGGKNAKSVPLENHGKARKQFAHGVKALIKTMHPEVLTVIAQLSDSAQLSFFGWETANLSKQDGKGMTKEDKDSKEILQAIKNGIKNNKNKSKLGIEIKDIKESLNVNTGKLYKKIWKILKSTDTNKKEQLQALKPRIETANATNKKLFTYVNQRLGELNASKNPMDRVGVLRIYKGTQNATSGFHRMFANFRHVEVYEGISQDPKNESHPLYKEAKVLSDEFNKEVAEFNKLNAKKIADPNDKTKARKPKTPAAFLKEYTEHLKENVFMLKETYGFAKDNNKKAMTREEYKQKLEAAHDNYDSSLNSHITTLDMDRSKFRDRKKVDAKTMGLGDKKMYYIQKSRMRNMYDILANKPSAESLADRVALENANEELRVGNAKRAKDKISLPEQTKKFKNYDKALKMANRLNAPEKGISILDFDDTLAKTTSKVRYTLPDGTKGKINATDFAAKSAALEAAGAKFDYSEFSKVKGGKKGPFFSKALKLVKKYGNKDVFILTARPQEAAPAIQKFLKGIGLDIKPENIIGLEDGKPEAKAEFIVDKAAEGYNRFLFADDAIKNTDAVSEVLDSLDINGKVYQVKQKFRQDLDKKFNKILQDVKGIDRNATFSDAAARVRGALNDKFWSRLFVPPSADDFKGLMYYFMGKGKLGEAHAKFFEESLFKPFAKAIRDINADRQRIVTEYSQLTKDMPDVKKKLLKPTDYSNFTYDQAMRVYLMNQNNIDVPGISKRDLTNLIKIIESDPKLVAYADKVSAITQLDEGYVQPDDVGWLASTIELDLKSITTVIKRSEYLTEWKENADAIFNDENLNKIEAVYGASVRESLENALYRMEHGTNRPTGMSKIGTEFTDWANGAVGNIMFLNTKSAVLQTISFANFVNWSDNNPLAYMKAVGNFPQFAKDFAMIWNSPFLKNRRAGLQTDVSAAEIINQAANSKNKVKAMIGYILGKGYLPTQMGDSFAICMGGAGFYRNRVNSYLKQGMDQKTAEEKAFADMQETSEDAQQSARPDKISMQQASEVGRWILSFQNTPMQYTRIMKKAALDLYNRRGDDKSNISKIVYYGALQNLLFSSLQNAIFALAFDDDEEKEKERYARIANNMADTILRGTGIYGAILSTLKNVTLELVDQSKKGYRADNAYVMLEAVNLSPALGSKARKVYSSSQSIKFNRDEIMNRGFHIDNPAYEAVANVTSAAINLPVDRALRITDNMREAANKENQAWQRIALALGWSAWDLGVETGRRKKDKKEKKKKGGVNLF